MRVCAAALVLVLALINVLDADVKRLELELIDRTRLSHDVLVALRSEVEQIWSRELALEWTTGSGSQRSGSDHLYVVLCRRNEPKPPHRAIATIVFIGSNPGTHIHAHPAEALALLGDDPALRYVAQPMKTRNRALGRVLGRAIAHEIGHYVRRSSQHSKFGLMKASHPIAALAGDDRSPFFVDSPLTLAANDCSVADVLMNLELP